MILYFYSIRPFCVLFNDIVYFIPYIEKQDEKDNQVEDDFHVAEVNFVHSAFSVESNPESVTLKEAFASKDSEKWRAAAQSEYDSLIEHDTWELCELPIGKKVIGSKWVLKVKYQENSEVDRYKCRLVAQGFTQAPGIDYDETFAPVARFGTIRTLLVIGAKRGIRIEQMDVTTAFLNGVLKENLYMAQPECVTSRNPSTV